MDRFLMYIYFVVTVVATCTILIRTSIFESFDQKEFSGEVAHERFCKDDYNLYNETCNDIYRTFCVNERNELHSDVIANPGEYTRATCEEYIRNLVV